MEQKIIFSIVGTVVVVITSIFGANVKKDLNEGKITEQNQIVATSNEVATSSEKEELDNKIETKEAIYLGTALSLDSFGIGIGGSIIGLNTFLFPFLVASFQLLFITIGTYLGNKIKNISNIPENIWSILSGTLLILIGLSKIAF